MIRAAEISACGRFRYWLTRRWDETKPMACFVMLNPSTADAEKDDATIRRCVGFALAWGMGGLVVVNLFALRSTDPRALAASADPVGPGNDAHILAAARASARLVCAWGNDGGHLGRGPRVLERLRPFRPAHLGLTGQGHPKHPLYLASKTPLTPFFPEG